MAQGISANVIYLCLKHSPPPLGMWRVNCLSSVYEETEEENQPM